MDVSPSPHLRAHDLPKWRRRLISQLVARLHLPVPLVYEMKQEALQHQLQRSPWAWLGLGVVATGFVLPQAFGHGPGRYVCFVGLVAWLCIGQVRARRQLVWMAGHKARRLARLRRNA
ncbi:hypothetical protein SAMN05428989_3487 [Pseudoxanthomonas sp. GM95]|uniref:hypothetical protein n=1 Tax=Pseudoxanthomonas sp. GM95 TaxID=1881043 RepID=UPI0008D77012|nr:hypothetical protein [Pseudoxanthomonas sp. GM95]SEM24550.1 hypothetical protein SAMN05428989_3487 [Pseudoxanthomonas sp. GM95]